MDDAGSSFVQQSMYTPAKLGQHKPSVLKSAQTGLFRHCDAVELMNGTEAVFGSVTGAVFGIG